MQSPTKTCPDVQLASFVWSAAGSGLTFQPSHCNTNGTECARTHVPSGLMLRCTGTACTLGPPLPEPGLPAPFDCPVVEAQCASNGGGSWSCSPAALRGGARINAAGLL